MDLNALTQAELHNAIALLLLTININAVQLNSILVETTKFDTELSMRILESLKAALEAGNELLIDSYLKQGLTKEQIEARIEYGKDWFGLDS